MTQPKDLPTRCEVLVLGAGMAGHCAALAAAEAGADVLLLEKAAQPGGSSAMAGGIFLFRPCVGTCWRPENTRTIRIW